MVKVRFTYSAERGGYFCSEPGNQDGEYIKVPADDAQPVTDDWLKSLGFEDGDPDPEVMTLFFTDAKGLGKHLEVEFESRIWFYLQNHNGSDSMRTYIAHADTRGAVRRLLAVLLPERGEPK